jgi:uncharacterized protein
MAQIPDIIKEKVREYIAELEKNKIHLKKAILFGSYANGKFNKWSDIDIALVSDSFEGDRYNDRKKISRITLDVDYRIDPLPYNTKDFEENNLFVKEIINTGISLI